MGVHYDQSTSYHAWKCNETYQNSTKNIKFKKKTNYSETAITIVIVYTEATCEVLQWEAPAEVPAKIQHQLPDTWVKTAPNDSCS
jgi:hypothetical protein